MSFKDRAIEQLDSFGVFLVYLVGTAAWITHVLRCINTESWLFLIAGAIAAPIGIIHGLGIWFGAF